MKGTRKVQVISSTTPPIQWILNNFFTTVVMNVISWNRAYSIFPRATFLRHHTFELKDMSDTLRPLYAKWEKRGWCRGRLEQEPDVVAHCSQPEHGGLTLSRRVGDQESWILELETTNVIPPTRPDYVLQYATFEVEKWNGNDQTTSICYYSMA